MIAHDAAFIASATVAITAAFMLAERYLWPQRAARAMVARMRRSRPELEINEAHCLEYMASTRQWFWVAALFGLAGMWTA